VRRIGDGGLKREVEAMVIRLRKEGWLSGNKKAKKIK